jgi:TrmH family RNA methyltransferase
VIWLEFKIIVVEPRYQINLGYIARISQNFGVRKLFLVRPRVKIGKTAIMFSKHAKDLLLNAKIYKDFDSSIKGCNMVIGTTGIWRKAGVNFKNVYLIEDAMEMASKLGKGKTVGIIIGRDDIGLKLEEVEKCDIVAYIGTDNGYPVLNISHALGIILYILTKKGFKSAYRDISASEVADRKEEEFLFEVFGRLIERKRIRNKKAVRNTFRRLVCLSQPNKREIHALITALK